MTLLLDPAEYPWVALVPPDELAGMREDLATGDDPEHCSHGTLVQEVIGNWGYFTLDEVPPPADWVGYDVGAELWFAYLPAESAALCRSEFAAAVTDEEREHLYWGWCSSGAIWSDPILTARLLDPID